jgi:hypothetical protein
MAEINKLSVGKALDRLRSKEARKTSGVLQLEEKIKTASEEIQRLRAARRRLRRGRPATEPSD